MPNASPVCRYRAHHRNDALGFIGSTVIARDGSLTTIVSAPSSDG
jgi:hypothetical protein